jgi:hypothetical protein
MAIRLIRATIGRPLQEETACPHPTSAVFAASHKPDREGVGFIP